MNTGKLVCPRKSLEHASLKLEYCVSKQGMIALELFRGAFLQVFARRTFCWKHNRSLQLDECVQRDSDKLSMKPIIFEAVPSVFQFLDCSELSMQAWMCFYVLEPPQPNAQIAVDEKEFIL
jgi:hypothetical protein